jgi:hypothetical protein
MPTDLEAPLYSSFIAQVKEAIKEAFKHLLNALALTAHVVRSLPTYISPH